MHGQRLQEPGAVHRRRLYRHEHGAPRPAGDHGRYHGLQHREIARPRQRPGGGEDRPSGALAAGHISVHSGLHRRREGQQKQRRQPQPGGHQFRLRGGKLLPHRQGQPPGQVPADALFNASKQTKTSINLSVTGAQVD